MNGCTDRPLRSSSSCWCCRRRNCLAPSSEAATVARCSGTAPSAAWGALAERLLRVQCPRLRDKNGLAVSVPAYERLKTCAMPASPSTRPSTPYG